jgi:hypothetical protein
MEARRPNTTPSGTKAGYRIAARATLALAVVLQGSVPEDAR